MSKLLHIKASVFGDEGQSSQLAARYIDQWQQRTLGNEVVVRDLVGDSVPHLDGAVVGAFFTPEEQRSAEQQAIVDFSDTLIKELQDADEIVLGLPLYNFGVPSQMKAYFDHLARAGVTFKYAETGPVGLLGDKPVRVFATRGGLYKDTGMDHQVPFLKQFLGFIGLNNVEVIYAEGLSMEEVKEGSLAKARAEVDQLASA
ncbi:NAD(P)H-dependent oxidoreductase [Pontibacterium granulatum]|uniref:FMN-dependent NADH-azoreductase n=1 Tax=Pontibacterium granulatum TaxID=2036029 RepID=UPI00249C4AEE|nr:NAD(P)H-dependent oxidoreductase [Pontibacterium granulatum]MDI3324387.1 NAD(P)H-dependent oxidoreductase [Pontibacterium granulatum]